MESADTARLLQLQRTAGNRAVARFVAQGRPPRRTIQRVIAGNLNEAPLIAATQAVYPDASDTSNYDWALTPLIQAIPQLSNLIGLYNTNAGVGTANAQLTAILGHMREIEGNSIGAALPLLTNMQNQSAADKAIYEELLLLRDQWVPLMQSVNNEIAGSFNIQRAGPGNRPDVKESVRKTFESGRLNLSTQEKAWITTYLQAQSALTDKNYQEALTAIWAKRAGYFNNVSSGKNNPYRLKGTTKEADVEYQTTDANKPVLWDQKAITIGKGQTTFEGRLDETHTKAVDNEETPVPVGLLFDSTYVDRRNYEIAWGTINEMLLSGTIPPVAIREVRALQPEVFLSQLDVKMAEKVPEGDPEKGKKNNIKWAENLKGAQQNGLFTIARNNLPANRLAQILNGTQQSYSRYANDRSWLPSGVVYNEYGAGISGSSLDSGSIKFVLSADLQAIYITPTHYAGYSVTPSGGQPQARNPFFRVL